MALSHLVSVLISAMSITFASLLILRPLAFRFGLVDTPSSRKLHSGSIPLIGGISVFIGLVTVSFLNRELVDKVLPLLATGSIIFLMGVIDDYKPLGVKVRVAVQILCASMMIFLTGLQVETFGYLLGFDSPINLGWLSLPVTILAVVGVTNAFNLVDGIDGLAGSLALVAIVGILVLQALSGSTNDYAYLVVVAACLIPYLVFNIVRSKRFKVFMGDGGSLFVGYVIVWSLIHQTQSSSSITPSSALWCIAIPLIDTIGVMSRRIMKGQSPFMPDRNHLHHILMRAGFSSLGALIFLVGLASSLLVVGLFFESRLPSYSFAGFLAVFLIYVWALNHAWIVQKALKRKQ